MERTTCCVIGGGPAGMVLGLLLARSGIEVTVLEKHGDFLRDFRGDTVHPTTLALLDELGLGERFAQLPQRRVSQIQIPLGPEGRFLTVGDFTQLRSKYNYIAMVPQWDLLNLLAEEAKREPAFTLRMNTEAIGFLREGGRVTGVRYRTRDGATGALRAALTVACDGRDSIARELPELGLRDFSSPMDVWWYRVPRQPDDPAAAVASMNDRQFMILLDRGDYYQAASIIGKGTDVESRARPIEDFNRVLVATFPWMAGRELVRTWDDVKLLDVRLDRLRTWHLPGLLCIGDAAHAMSPVGGIGINLAVQDAVAAARHLVEPLRRGTPSERDLAAVQRRRWPTTVLIQGFQRTVHKRVIVPALEGSIGFADTARLPLPVRVASRIPWARRIPPYLLAYGAMRERPPASALR